MMDDNGSIVLIIVFIVGFILGGVVGITGDKTDELQSQAVEYEYGEWVTDRDINQPVFKWFVPEGKEVNDG